MALKLAVDLVAQICIFVTTKQLFPKSGLTFGLPLSPIHLK